MRGRCASHVASVLLALAFALVAPLTAGAQVQDRSLPAVAADRAAEQDTALRGYLAERVVSAREQATGRPFDPASRADLLRRLATLPLDALELANTEGMLPRQPGDTGQDLVYVPVTPCRVFDTRYGAGGIIPAGGARNLRVAGNLLAGQGGNADCGIPFGIGAATGVAVNLTAVGFAAPGNLRAAPFGAPMPFASVLNYAPGMGAAVANALPLPTCDPAVTDCTYDITLQADATAVHVVGDVVGYYRAFAPVTHLRDESNSEEWLPSPTMYKELNSLSIASPRMSGTVLLRARGFCYVIKDGTVTEVLIGIGTTAGDAFNGDYDNLGFIRTSTTGVGEMITSSYSAEKLVPVSRGVPTTVQVYAWRLMGTAPVGCRGSVVAEGLF